MRKLFGLIVVCGSLAGLGAGASAQGFPPAYAGPMTARHELQGVVREAGGYHMDVRVDGREVPVDLHRGTVIRPTGLTLHRGMLVRIGGFWANGAFVADRIVLIR